ncbi:MAG: ABC transporter permease subunit, partial [Bacillota bacterium]|nr:ABC transporter permease subunit [Bacillota bacterium]
SGYIFCAFILLFAGIYTMVINLKEGYANFEYVLDSMSFIFLIAVPILSMKIISEEKRQKTDQLLYSLPLSMTQVVMGKYLAMITVLLIPCAVMGIYPLLLSVYGKVTLLTSYASLLAFFCLGAALLSIGLFISSLTESQAVSAVLCLIAMLVNYFISALASYVSASSVATFIVFMLLVILVALLIYFMSKNTIISLFFSIISFAALLIMKFTMVEKFQNMLPGMMKKLSVFERFYTFTGGLFDLTSLVYFALVTIVFLFLTIQSMEKRRWS